MDPSLAGLDLGRQLHEGLLDPRLRGVCCRVFTVAVSSELHVPRRTQQKREGREQLGRTDSKCLRLTSARGPISASAVYCVSLACGSGVGGVRLIYVHINSSLIFERHPCYIPIPLLPYSLRATVLRHITAMSYQWPCSPSSRPHFGNMILSDSLRRHQIPSLALTHTSDAPITSSLSLTGATLFRTDFW